MDAVRGPPPSAGLQLAEAECKAADVVGPGVTALYMGGCTHLLHPQAEHLFHRLPRLRTLCFEWPGIGPRGFYPHVDDTPAHVLPNFVNRATLASLASLCPNVTAVAVRGPREEGLVVPGSVSDCLRSRWRTLVALTR